MKFLVDYADGKCKYFKEINQILEELSEELPCSGLASSKGLTCRSDGIHFDSESYREF